MAAKSPQGSKQDPGLRKAVAIPEAGDVRLAKNDVLSTVVADVPRPTLGAAVAYVLRGNGYGLDFTSGR